MQLKSFSLSTIAGLTLGILLIGYSAFAIWAPPANPPPNGNTPAPLNTGSSDQTKTGGTLTLQGDVVSQNKTIKGDDIILGTQAGNGITTDGDIVVSNASGQEKVGLHAGNPVVAIFKGIASLFNTSDEEKITLDPNNQTIAVGNVTVKGDGSISPNLNSSKLQDLDAASLMAAGGGGMTATPDPYHYIYFYYSANEHNGNLGGLSGANTICDNEKAEGVPSGLTYKAYLCNNTTCQKPIAGMNTIVVGLSPKDASGTGSYKIVNLLKGPDYIDNTTGFSEQLKHGLSGIYDRTNTTTFSLLNFLGGNVSAFWVGSFDYSYLNSYAINVFDTTPSGASNCGYWNQQSSSSSGRVGTGGFLFVERGWVSHADYSCDAMLNLLCFAQ